MKKEEKLKESNPDNTTTPLNNTSEHHCNSCKTNFPSKTKLHDHLKATGHA